MTQHVNTIIFDMDGVITDSMTYHYRAWKKIFADNGIHATKFDIYAREGQKGIDSVYELFAEAGLTLAEGQAERMIRDKEIFFKKIIKRKFISGARTFIKALVKKGFKLALVTGTARHEVEQVLPSQLLKLFTVTITGDDVIKGKPNPEPYLKAVKRLGIKKQNAIVIENAPFGIISAHRAGIRCYAIQTSLPKKYLKEADRIFSGHGPLSKYIFKTYVNL